MPRYRLPLALLALLLFALPAQAQDAIRLNQVGFYPAAPKVAIAVTADADSFFVREADGSAVVYRGALGPAETWSPSGETVRQADFSDLAAPGTYVVEIPEVGTSHRFEVGEQVHQDVALASLKAYYFMRASTRILSQHGGAWARPPGHPDDEVRVHPSAASEGRPAGTTISAPGGWYDAGDYNKYIVNSGISTGTLLQLYEHFPTYFDAVELGIPESGDAVPDLLDEVLWNVRWMLAMQDPADGGVYHKLTHANFSGAVMPHQATAPRYVVQKGTAATLDFAAVTAQASRIFADFEDELPGLSDSLRTASLDAWRWARANPNVRYSQSAINAEYDPDIQTGEYGDGSFDDEFDWAAMELYVTTGADSFLTITQPTEPIQMGIPWWGGVRELGYYSLLHHREAIAEDVDTTALKNSLLAAADRLVADQQTSAYDVVMGGSNGDFNWGSNSGAGNQGVLLLQAYRLTGDDRYLQAALSNLDYLLGRNATAYSFVTGHGDRPPMHPHHRPSEADNVEAPVPGMLVGGPNPGQQDGCAYPSDEPAQSYVDTWCSYASNEITINWNAPLAYLAGAIEAMTSPTGLPTSDAAPPALPQGVAPPLTYPNPFGDTATIRFVLPDAAPATIVVYDTLGRRVETLLDGEVLASGLHEVALDAAGWASGAYVVRVEAGRYAGSATVARLRAE